MNQESRIMNHGKQKTIINSIIHDSCFMIHTRKGFTLIELLVVVAVLGIVAGGILIALNIGGIIGKASLTKAKTFSSQLERGLILSQVGKWSFEDGTGATIAKDTSGYGNDGDVTSAILGLPSDPNCKDLGFGGCLDVETVDGSVEVADKDFFSPSVNDMTVSVWAKVPGEADPETSSGCGGIGRYIIAKGSTGNWEWGIENDNNDRICFITWQGPPLAVTHLECDEENVTVNDNRWHHYAIVIKPSEKIIGYRDGSQACQSDSYLGSMGDGTSPVHIGRRGDGKYFKGFIDEASIYNEALTLSQIQDIYAQGVLRKEISLRF